MNTQTGRQILVTAHQRAELVAAQDEAGDLGPNEVIGRTLATLISPGTELNGNYLGEHFPMRPGYAAVFEVEAVGAAVTRLRPGSLAFVAGKHRSWQRALEADVLPVPPGLEPSVAVFARMMGVSMTTLISTRARPPARVLVTGLGLVGYLAAQIFAACGFEVTAIEPNAHRRRLATRSGLRDVRERVPLEEPALCAEIALVLECSGVENAALEGCRAVRVGGEVVLVGAPWRARTELRAFDLIHTVFHRYVTLRSGWEWALPTHETAYENMHTGLQALGSISGNLQAALRWLAEGRVDVTHLFETVAPEEAQAVYQRLLHDPDSPLTFVFDWSLHA